MRSHFFKPPQSYRSVELWLITPPLPQKDPVFSVLFSLWLLLAEKMGIDQAKSDQAVKPPCVDMSHSLPAARPLARLRSSQAAVRQIWCVDCILPVGWIKCCMCDLRKWTVIEIICIVSSSMIVLLEVCTYMLWTVLHRGVPMLTFTQYHGNSTHITI